jgi:hypothetical protein
MLAALEVTGRVPQLHRQVPVGLFGQLPPGMLGIAWGLDLGLMITTKKTTSIAWAALLGSALLAPDAAPAVTEAFAISSALLISIRAVSGGWKKWRRPDDHSHLRALSRPAATAVLLSLLAAAMAP